MLLCRPQAICYCRSKMGWSLSVFRLINTSVSAAMFAHNRLQSAQNAAITNVLNSVKRQQEIPSPQNAAGETEDLNSRGVREQHKMQHLAQP